MIGAALPHNQSLCQLATALPTISVNGAMQILHTRLELLIPMPGLMLAMHWVMILMDPMVVTGADVNVSSVGQRLLHTQ